jgi:hypothetical protein
MTIYVCDRCKKDFNNNTHYKTHLNRKNPCKKLKDFTCVKCNNLFSTKRSLDRHILKFCKKNQTNEFNNSHELITYFMKKINEVESSNKQYIEKFNKQGEDIKKQGEDMKKLQLQLNNSKVTNIQNNNNIQNNINILAYGSETLSHIKKEDFEKLFNSGHSSIPDLIKLIHYNDKVPQNANMYISNLKTNYVIVFDGIKWILKQMDEHLNELFENSTEHLEDNFTNLLKSLSKRTKNRFTRFLDQIDEDKTKNGVKDNLKLLMYNERNLPLRMVKNGNQVAITGIPEFSSTPCFNDK